MAHRGEGVKIDSWTVFLLAALAGCGGNVSVDGAGPPEADCALPPPGTISSLEALAKARCAIAEAPESALVEMRTEPLYIAPPDGLGQWWFGFAEVADTTAVRQVSVGPAGIFTKEWSYPPCAETIEPFDSVALAQVVVPLAPPSFTDMRLDIRKHVTCSPYEAGLGGLTDVFLKPNDQAYNYLHFLFDDAGSLVETCALCMEYQATSCDCGPP